MIKQFFDEQSSSFTYLVTSEEQKAFLVDPVLDNNKIYQDFISQHSLTLSFILETHTHADHVTGSGTLNDIYGCKIYCGLSSNSKNFETVSDDQEILLDNLSIKALYTPGHTDDSFSYLLRYYQDCYLFTGDTLLINGCGRTDFQNGDSGQLYDSINQKLFSLGENTAVLPGHDYNGLTRTTIGDQKRTNPRLANKSKDEFIHIMNNLNLPTPKLMDLAVPLNLNLGKSNV